METMVTNLWPRQIVKIEKRSRMVANNDDYNRETQKGSSFLAQHSQVKQYGSMIRWWQYMMMREPRHARLGWGMLVA
jgi:hypothetical protein